MKSFIKNTLKNNIISAKEFWQLREFYSPGIITFDNKILEYKSQKVTSREILVKKTDYLQTHVQPTKDYQIIFQRKNELITKKDGVTFIYFIKPISEMRTANGFFDYEDKDKALLRDKMWLVVAQFSK